MLKETNAPERNNDIVTIKKYANRRLYNTESSTYVTLDDLGEMVRADRDFVVFDAKSGDDLTHSVLTQIIVDQESRGQNMLPVPFLRQLIRFYDDSISRLVPGYLQFSLEALAQEQDAYRGKLQAFPRPTAALELYQDQVRRNMEVFEQAMAIWIPFKSNSQGSENALPNEAGSTPEVHLRTVQSAAQPSASKGELDQLKSQLEAMQQKVDELTKKSDQ